MRSLRVEKYVNHLEILRITLVRPGLEGILRRHLDV
jgi:hypothetical protein